MASAVGSVLGSIVGSRASKSGNSTLSAIGSAIGSAVASQAASALVKTVHDDSTQRVLEKREREAANARGEVPKPPTKTSRNSVFDDAGDMFQRMGTSMGGVSFTKQRTGNNQNARSNTGGEKEQFPWREAAKVTMMAVSACVEMQRESKSSTDKRKR